jgi:hypothetical protein
VVEDGHNLYKQAERREGFRPGDPSAACDAVKTLIQRDLAKHSVDVARQALATGSKIAGACVDLGTGTNAAIGTANALAGLGLQLFALGIDIKDMRAGNARLKRPDTIDHTVFEECPILGCLPADLRGHLVGGQHLHRRHRPAGLDGQGREDEEGPRWTRC